MMTVHAFQPVNDDHAIDRVTDGEPGPQRAGLVQFWVEGASWHSTKTWADKTESGLQRNPRPNS
jgi:hypothetical protein